MPLVLDRAPAVLAGQRYYWWGYLRGFALDHFDVRVGKHSCDMSEEVYANLQEEQWEDPPPDRSDGVGGVVGRRHRWWREWWWCETAAQAAGWANVSIRVDQPTHGGGFPKYHYTVPGLPRFHDDTVHDMVLVPQVHSLSMNKSGWLGGSRLHLNVTGIDAANASNNQVLIGGAHCTDVIVETSNTLSCALPPASALGQVVGRASQPVLGGWGLHGTVSWQSSHQPDLHWGMVSDLRGRWGFQDRQRYNFIETGEGFFVPPFTANYTFWVRGDDYTRLFLSKNASSSGAEEVASNHRVIDTFEDTWVRTLGRSPASRSKPMLLSEGQPYYIRSSNQQWGGAEYYNVALQVQGAVDAQTHPNIVQSHSVREVQEVVLRVEVVREQQQLTVLGLEGSSKLMLRLETGEGTTVSSAFALRDGASAVDHAAQAILPGCGSVSVSEERIAPSAGVNETLAQTQQRLSLTGSQFTVTIHCGRAGMWPDLQVVVRSAVPLRESLPGGGLALAQYSTQHLRTRMPNQPAAGAWMFHRAGIQSPVFDVNVAGHEVAEALTEMVHSARNGTIFDPLPEISVRTEGNGLDGKRWVITYASELGAQPPLQVSGVDLSGSDVSITSQPLLRGSTDELWFDTVPMTFFRSPFKVNQSVSWGPEHVLAPVHVRVGGVVAACDEWGSPLEASSVCSVEYQHVVTPEVLVVSPKQASAGDLLNIHGNRLARCVDSCTIKVGQATCHVQQATEHNVSCILGEGEAGVHLVALIDHSGPGRASGNATVTVPLRVDSMSPTQGSLAGGTLVNITGSGFDRLDATRNEVVFSYPAGASHCVVLQATSTELLCRTPMVPGARNTSLSALHAASGSKANVSVSGLATRLTFAHTSTSTPTLESVHPARLSYGISGLLTLVVSNWAVADGMSVHVGARPCRIYATQPLNGSVQCFLDRPKAGSIAEDQGVIVPVVRFPQLGTAAAVDGVGIDVSLKVHSLSMVKGSRLGGAVLHIAGSGFSPRRNANEVLFLVPRWGQVQGRFACHITNFSVSAITCEVPPVVVPAWDVLHQSADVISQVHVRTNQVVAACNNCTWTWSATSTPRCSAVVQLGRDSLRIGGTNLLGAQAAVGGKACIATGGTDTELQCQLPALDAGEYSVTITSALGTGNCSSSPAIQYNTTVDSLSPRQGSASGGTLLYVRGWGFNSRVPAANKVMVSSGTASVVQASPDLLVVSTPPGRGSNPSITVQVFETEWDFIPDFSSVFHDVFSYVAPGALVGDVQVMDHVGGRTHVNISLQGSGVKPLERARVGGVPAAIVQATESWVHLSTSVLPAGQHSIELDMADNFGLLAQPSDNTITVPLDVEQRGRVNSSFAGGGRLELVGTGLGMMDGRHAAGETCAASLVSVLVCGVEAAPTFVGNGSGAWSTPPLLTKWSPQLAFAEPAELERASIIGNSGSAWRRALLFDGDLGRGYYGGSTDCSVGIDVGDGAEALLTRVRWYAAWTSADALYGAELQGSTGPGESWVSIASVETQPTEGWNYIDVPSGLRQGPWRLLRFKCRDGTQCRMNELQFIGHLLTTRMLSNGTCDVQVLSQCTGELHQLRGAAVQYTTSASPVVHAVSPAWGPSTGGTDITLTGSNFPVDATSVSVKAQGAPCIVQSVSHDTLKCTTTARLTLQDPGIQVSFGSTGNAIISPAAKFRFLDRWSDPNTWQFQQRPREGESVVIPPSQTILLDMNVSAFLLLIQGELVWDDSPENDNLELNATYIFVHGGALELGTEALPLRNRATITLHGDRYKNTELPQIGAKCLAIMDRTGYDLRGGALVPSQALARLDVHGIPRTRVWTMLAEGQHVAAGSSHFTTAEPTDFQVGERVVLPSTGTSFREAEERVIGEVLSPTKYKVTRPFAFEHRADVFHGERLGHSAADMRGEVGLLTRNIVIQGDEHSTAQDFGAHTMAMGGGVYRVENAEFRRCGQSFLLGRYCTHAHMAGRFDRSYVKANSIHHSFQRATTIHGVSHFEVKHNFAYHIKGHSFFVEDGAEEFNVIEENLVAVTLRCSACLKGDTKPASFWTASPRQFWRHNRAAGCTNDGYWLELPGHPHGPSFTLNTCPNHEHLGEFFNNTAHSNGVHGLRLYPVVLPRAEPCSNTIVPYPMYFLNFTTFRNGVHGVFGKLNGDIHHINVKSLENVRDDLFWTKLAEVRYREDDAHIQNGLFVGSIDPQRAPRDKVGVFAPQREFFHIDGATFVNYGRGALATCAKCGEQMSLAQGGFTYRVEGLVFVNSTQRVKWGPGRKDIIYDLDGSLTGRGPRSWASPYWSFNAAGTAPACTREDSATATYDDAILCDASVEVRRIGIDMYEPDELRAVSLGVSPADHPVYEDNKVGFLFKEIAGWVFPIVTRRWIRLWFHNTPLDWHELQIRFSEPDYIGAHAPESEWVGLKLNWTDTRYRNKVLYGKGVQDYWGEDIASEAAEVAALGGIEEFPTLPDREPLPSDHFGTGWLERRNSPGFLNNTWSLMLNNVFNSSRGMPLDALSGRYGTHRVFVKNLQCPPRGCPVPGVDIRPGTPMLWSAPSTWHHMRDMWGLSETEPDRLPREGDDVTVPPSMWLVLDVADTPALGHLRIEGRLTFADSKDLTLTLQSALVLGEWQIGSPDAPFQHAARVEFVGGRNSPAVIVDNSQFLSNKVLGVYGNLTVYGKPAGVTWTRLAASAGKGATELTLQQPVSWGAGDEIVISATEYDARQSEVRHIVAVSNGGFTLHLSSPLEFAHFGNEQRIAGRQMHLAAGVGLLTRSVTFSGIITDSTVRINSPWPTMYGFHIYAGEFKRAGDGAGVREFIGRIDMNNARLNNSAKAGSMYAGIDIRFRSAATVESDDDAASVTTSERPQHRIVGCSFSHSNNYAIRFEGAPGMVIHDNVIHSTFRSAVYDPVGDSPGARIEGNFVVGVHHSPDEVATAGTSSSWIFPFAGMYLFSRVASLQGNLVAASDDAGFTLRPPLCGGVGEVVRDNEAHSVLIGAFLIGAHVNERVQCQAFSDFTVWKAAHMGVFTTDQTSHMRISRVVVSDSHVGMALNYFRTARTSFSNVSDSVFIGQSQASSCDESVQCRAQMDEDPLAEECNSEVGPDYRSVGIMLPQYTNRAKTCYSDITSSLPKEACWPPTLPERTCNMPWEHRHGLASTRHAQLVLKGVTFSNFAADSCGLKSAAVKSHPSQSEFGVPVSMSSMRWEGVDEAARFSLAFEHANEKCTSRGCDGFDAAFVLDEDGSTFSVPAALVRHPAMAVGRTCTSATAWGEGALICPDLLRLRGFVTESLDRDRSFRRLEPVAVSRSEPGTPAGVAAYGAHGPLSDACAKRFFFAQYHSALLADGNTVLLNVTGTLPSRFRMHFMSPDPDEGVVIALFVRRPFRMNVYHGTRKVEALAEPGRLPTVADPHGTNVYIPQANTLWVTVRGHSTYASYTIVRTAEVQLDLTLAMSVADFYSSAVVRNLATLLNINPDQIRVADVQAASTKVTLYILPPGGQAAAEVVPPADDPDPRAVSPDFQEDAQPTLPSFINPVVEPNATAAGASTVAVPDGDLLTTSWDDSGYESMLDEVAEYAAVIEEAAKSGELTQALGVEVLALSISRPSTNSTANSTSGDVVVIQRQEPEPAGDSDSAVAPLLLGILVGAGGAATLAAAIMSYLMFCKSPPRPVPAAKSRVAPAASSSIQRDARAPAQGDSLTSNPISRKAHSSVTVPQPKVRS